MPSLGGVPPIILIVRRAMPVGSTISRSALQSPPGPGSGTRVGVAATAANQG